MLIRIANIYLSKRDDEFCEQVRGVAEKVVALANEDNTTEIVVKDIGESLRKRFPARSFNVSFHTYSDREVSAETGARNSSLVDISIDDEYSWLGSESKKDAVPLPNEIRSALAEYQNAAFRYTGAVSWQTGRYQSDDSAELLEFETTVFPLLADRCLNELIGIAKGNVMSDARIDATFLLGYATDRERESIEALFTLLESPDHAIHNMAARSLFPKAIARRCEFLSRASTLLNHQCSYCLNKYIGTASVLEWTEIERAYLASILDRIELLAKNKQPAVFLPAKVVLERLA